jgi:ATP/maltotriose-dependent transcriptional regulator MalT
MRGEEGAVARAHDGIEMWEMGGAVIMRPALLSELADASAYAGDLDGATQAIDGAFSWLQRSDEHWAEPELHRIRARIALRRGDHAAAREAIAAGIECARRTGAHGLAARLQETLDTVHEMPV